MNILFRTFSAATLALIVFTLTITAAPQITYATEPNEEDNCIKICLGPETKEIVIRPILKEQKRMIQQKASSD